MNSILAAFVLSSPAWLAQDPPQTSSRLFYFGDPEKVETRLSYMVRDIEMFPPKLSPKKFGDVPIRWEFNWVIAGYGRPEPEFKDGFKIRFRVFSQTRGSHNTYGVSSIRALLKMWDYNYRQLEKDHSKDINSRIVDLYLTFAGPMTGGEQLMDQDDENDRERKVNTMYIYDTVNLKDMLEALREVAHEYGHATLWPIGGFKTPEDWVNGYLGEKIYLKHIRDELKAGRYETIDCFGVTLEQLDKWVKTNVDDLMQATAQNGPSPMLTGDGQGAVDGFCGLTLYLQQILPRPTFLKIMKATEGHKTYSDLPMNAVEFVSSRDQTVFDIPESYRSKPFWVPIGEGKISGGNILEKKNGWAKVQSLAGVVTVKKN